jgi:L-asparaginase II
VLELAVVERSGLVESRHLGAAVVVGPDGAVLEELGDSSALVYPRSSLKPLQAIGVLRSGVELDGVDLVLASASHAGTPEHVAIVSGLLASAGLDASALQCPADWPLDGEARDAVLLAGGTKSSILMNCSGKHASFLLSSVRNGWPVDSYLDPGHPLQQLVRSTVSDYAGEPVEHTGVDGCGAPLHALTLAGLARAISRVAAANDPEAARLTAAIVQDPWALDGHGRANTVAIEELGVIAKGGAEGVMVMSARDGTAVAVKVLDGSMRAVTMIAIELLARAGVVDRAAADRVIAGTTDPVLGGGEPVGELRAAF